ncbi:hypothetical protein O181_082808 [Austropuccinia psidii MF-1]|uniref:Uncharacterized protein n=1 Tax=Austropuccinia psidii MF-1 TaxID=1389203 RepID=A0A9Q3FN78_9BASI|nr:hypothetical protein [Austropuccinia psidii MF-1]
MLPQIQQVVINSRNILRNFLKEEEIVRYSNGWNPLPSKPQIKTIKDWSNKKREASMEEAPVASTRKPQTSQPPPGGKKNKKINCRKPYFPSYRLTRIPKDAMNNFFNIARTLIEFKEKEEQK